MDKAPYIFGSPNEWRIFAEQHHVFMERLPRLHEVIQKIIARKSAYTPKPIDRVVAALGWICAHDFEEILVLCGNGLGIGGLKLLRGLYERAVTAQYLAAHPDEVQKFFDYNAIHLGKFFIHTEEGFNLKSKLSTERIDEIKSARKEAEKRFQEPVCKQCGISRTQMSWSANDLLSMAIKARKTLKLKKGEGLDGLYSICYFMPTLHTHPAFFAFKDWVEFSDKGMEWKTDAEQSPVGHAMSAAHGVMLHVLNTQNDYFQLGLDEELGELNDDYVASWRSSH